LSLPRSGQLVAAGDKPRLAKVKVRAMPLLWHTACLSGACTSI